jgi:hypothetical protein
MRLLAFVACASRHESRPASNPAAFAVGTLITERPERPSHNAVRATFPREAGASAQIAVWRIGVSARIRITIVNERLEAFSDYDTP